jgi:hypothetical protein
MDLGPEGVHVISKYLMEPLAILSKLCLSNNHFIGREAGEALSNMLAINSTLLELDVSSAMQVGSPGYKQIAHQHEVGADGPDFGCAIAPGLVANQTLTSLDVSHNYLVCQSSGIEGVQNKGDLVEYQGSQRPVAQSSSKKYHVWVFDGISRFADAIKNNKALTQLNIEKNSLGAEGAKRVASALESNAVLTQLNAAHNNLGEMVLPEGWTVVGSLYHFGEKYKHAGGTERKIHPGTAEGAIALASAVKGNCVLTSLNLSTNCLLSEGGATPFADALKSNRVLLKLNLSENGLLTPLSGE